MEKYEIRKEIDNMNKLKNIIIKATDFGKMPKGFSPYMVQELVRIYHNLLTNQESEFLAKEIMELLQKCNIKIRESGIGWVACP